MRRPRGSRFGRRRQTGPHRGRTKHPQPENLLESVRGLTLRRLLPADQFEDRNLGQDTRPTWIPKKSESRVHVDLLVFFAVQPRPLGIDVLDGAPLEVL